jgi:hypothetical protein
MHAAEEAVRITRHHDAGADGCFALFVRARVAVAGVGPILADADLKAASRLVAESGALTYEPFIHEELGRLHGDETELREALRLYKMIGATGHARRLQAEVAGVPLLAARPEASLRIPRHGAMRKAVDEG